MGNTGKSYEIDILNGPILKNYIIFIVPLACGYILQLFFNAADVIVVGQFAGAGALAAVGSTTALVSLYLQIYIGLATGVNIEVAKAYATGSREKISKIVHTSVGMSFIGCILFLVLGLFTARPMLVLTDTPDDILDMASLYMYIWCIGMPASIIYNVGAAILRSVGDTKRPMYFLIVAGVVNFVLNIVSVVIFHMGVAGVAIATTVSNYISSALIWNVLIHEKSSLRVELRRINLDLNTISEILQLGVPIAIQNSFYTIPNILIQSSVNTFGSVFVAANSASSSLEGFQISILTANGAAAATFISQHYSAQKYKRAGEVLRTILICSTVSSLFIGTLFYIFRAPLISIFNGDPEIIRIGSVRLTIMVMTDFLDATMCIISNAIRGIGHSVPPMVITLIFVCGFRMAWLLLLFPFQAFHTYEFVILAWPVSWILAIPVLWVYYLHVRKE